MNSHKDLKLEGGKKKFDDVADDIPITTPKNHIERLPSDLISYILSNYLSLSDARRFANTCKNIYFLAHV